MNAPDHSSLQDTLPLVLVVDDEARSIDAIRRNLEEDFRVLTATSADEARGLLERHEISVILCDQRMPGTSGVKFLKEVRELGSGGIVDVPYALQLRRSTGPASAAD